ncbi:HlyD family secretion protein [Ralstonia pseudosolanacearum]|uniref:HlyD family efflux transporter periplasmic adaptor subunit n=1 Tax=Ralstonia solanacearum TaxID=305 RepID=A0A0S4WNH6_RALSL|nr:MULTISPECIES: HlyD family efflux transporter periplasmic adaptor subunit [Ralstonia]QWQ11871.1 HlyD family efflux transporter periplasmic adaptor subunit [Ralstonia solanacearum]UZF14738.1 HlyD family efflux transporter periplasmic adaptor subunit [Ralstonia solanacearum]UZF24840.1 HlyD family efflux transporter periplasmic adaptor subunit [Ralstonia sp. RS642]UZF29874.1 HlyD family efflux transporter periplasmic adaptor subunit [Ralstonia sp. RS650]CUV53132.1 HlyD family secretion protein 
MRPANGIDRAGWMAAVAMAAAVTGCGNPDTQSYQGYVEGEFVYVASPVGGRLEHLGVQRGQTVSAGTPLFILESTDEAAARQQAAAQQQAAEAQLADLNLGRRVPEVDAVRAQLAQAVAADQLSATQRVRDEAQFRAGGIPQAQLDASRSTAQTNAQRVRELTNQLRIAQLPARTDQIHAQSAQVEAARAAVAQAQWRLDQKAQKATQGGLVFDTLYREGEWVGAGSPVVRMLPPANVKVRFFVPQGVVGRLKPGQAVRIRCDGCAAEVNASISYVANEAEYTPPVIYSNTRRDKLVFMVEARPAVEDGTKLRPGQPVEVALP